jgi:hypothetical protein
MRVNGLIISNNYDIDTDRNLKDVVIFNSCYHDTDNKDMIELSSKVIQLFKMIRGYDVYVDNEDITELLESIENMYEEIEIPSSFNVYMRFWFKHIMKSIKETWFDIYFDAVEITYTDGMQYKHPISYQIHTLKAFYEVIHRIHTERQNDDDN